MTPPRFLRLTGLAGLFTYCALLLASSVPIALVPFKPLVWVQLNSGYLLHLVGVTPGLEVFQGRTAPRAIHRMSCFRITGEGDTRLVLYDDLERCRRRRVDAIRDPFQTFLVRGLAGPLVDIDLGARRSLAQAPMQPLFLVTDYYCHVPAAEQARVRAVSIESLYLGLSVDDGSTGEVVMRGRRRCNRPTWEIR
jgi:hypothetical protein